jgi:hypothetical protein
MRRCYLERFNQGLTDWFLELGFNMKVEPAVSEIEKIEFCQMHPIKVGDGYIMVRNPDTSLAKDSVSKIPIGSEKDIHTWCNSVGVGGYSAYPDIPVISALYKSYSATVPYDLGKARNLWEETGLQRMLAGVHRKGVVSAETRCSFYVAFGILPDVQIELEKYYSTIRVGPEIKLPLVPGEEVPRLLHAPESLSFLIQDTLFTKLTC